MTSFGIDHFLPRMSYSSRPTIESVETVETARTARTAQTARTADTPCTAFKYLTF